MPKRLKRPRVRVARSSSRQSDAVNAAPRSSRSAKLAFLGVVGLVACGPDAPPEPPPPAEPVAEVAPAEPIELVLELKSSERDTLGELARAAVEAEAQRRGHRYDGEITVDLSCEGSRCKALVRAEPD